MACVSQGADHGPELPELVNMLLLEDGEVQPDGSGYVNLGQRMKTLKEAVASLPQKATA
jgi:hypothetical protein